MSVTTGGAGVRPFRLNGNVLGRPLEASQTSAAQAPWLHDAQLRTQITAWNPQQAHPVIARSQAPAHAVRDTFLGKWDDLPQRLRLGMHHVRTQLYGDAVYAASHASSAEHVRQYPVEDAQVWWERGVPDQRVFTLRHAPALLNFLYWPDRMAGEMRAGPATVQEAVTDRDGFMLQPLNTLLESFGRNELWMMQFATAMIPSVEGLLASYNKQQSAPAWFIAMFTRGAIPSFEPLSPRAEPVLRAMQTMVEAAQVYRAHHASDQPLHDVQRWVEIMEYALQVNASLEYFRILNTKGGDTGSAPESELVARVSQVMAYYNEFASDPLELYSLMLASRWQPGTLVDTMRPMNQIIQRIGRDHSGWSEMMPYWDAVTKPAIVACATTMRGDKG